MKTLNATFRIGTAPGKDPVSSGPTANPDAFDVNEGTTTTLNPLANDDDPAGEGLTVVGTPTVTGHGGSAVISNADTRIDFTAPSGSGTSEIAYTCRDANGQESSSTITVTVSAVVAGDRTATISASRTSGTASANATFEIDLAGFDGDAEQPLQDCLIVWNFGDPGSTFADHSGRLNALNMMDATQKAWNDANVAYGPYVHKVFRNPGPHTVYAEVYYHWNAAPIRSNEIEFTAIDPDAAYSASQTIYAANDSDFSEAPAGADTITTTSGQAAFDALSGYPKRVVFKRGHSFSGWTEQGNRNKLWVGAFGSGTDRAIIDASAGISYGGSADSSEIVFKDLELRGTFDMTDNSGGGKGCSLEYNSKGHVCFDNVFGEGHGDISTGDKSVFTTTGKYQYNAGDLRTRCTYIDCMTNHRYGYAWFGHWYEVGFLGIHVDFPSNGFNHVDVSPGHGAALRIQQYKKGYFGCIDVKCPYKVNYVGFQPVLKLQGGDTGASNLDDWTNIDRAILEGGVLSFTGTGSIQPNRQFSVWDKVLIVGTRENGSAATWSNRGGRHRNIVYWQPHGINQKKDLGQKAINNDYAFNLGTGGTTENQNARLRIDSYTIVFWPDVDLHTDHPGTYSAGDAENYNDTEVTNGILHVPWDKSSTSQIADADLSQGAGIGQYEGYRDPNFNGGVLMDEYATDAQFTYSKNGHSVTNQWNFCIVTPQGANLTPDEMTPDNLAFDYVDGTLRGASPAKGAFKP